MTKCKPEKSLPRIPYVYMCMGACACMYRCIYVNTYTYICIYVYMCIFTYVYKIYIYVIII